MKKAALTFLHAAFVLNAFAQRDSFDIISYNMPKGWKKESRETVTSLSYVDKKDKSWCVIGVYKSVGSKGTVDQDFQNDWNDLVAKTYHITDTPQAVRTQEADGWKIKVGAGKFKFNKADAAAMLTTFTGYGRSVSILATTVNQRYVQDIQDLVGSIALSKPTGTINNTANERVNGTVNQQTASSSAKGYTFNTSNFDDGWTSVIKDDWIEVTRAGTKVYLFYSVPYNASDFAGKGIRERDYYWDSYVSKYFNIQTKQYRDDGETIGSFQPNYVEGWAKDKQTGEKRFIAMTLSMSPNAIDIVLASAKDEKSLYQQFPNANKTYSNDLLGMQGYNKFAVTANDVMGTWQSGGTSTMQWYYSTPSGYEGYAGMTGAAISATFNFGPNGNYTSIHNGATGVVGAMNTFQQNYKGKYTVTNWNLTATNRWDGKTDNFDAWFVVVRGGRILMLTAGGMEYKLVKAVHK